MPVEIPARKGDPVMFDTDEIPFRGGETTLQALEKLRPAFKKGGMVTAGNSSKISDGASALVVMSRERARNLVVRPWFVWEPGGTGMDMKYVLVAPIYSIPKVLAKAGLSIGCGSP